MACVSFASMQVFWNGGFIERFNPSRGVRQGDPMSTYLFVLTMERLSHAIHEAAMNDRGKPIQLERGGLKLSHLFFTDDLVLFGEATLENARVFRGFLRNFAIFQDIR